MFISGAKRRSLSGLTDNTETTTSKNCLEATPAPPSNSKLVLSGGEGYVDFRIGLYQGQYLRWKHVLSTDLFDCRNYLCIMRKILPKFFFSNKSVQYRQ